MSMKTEKYFDKFLANSMILQKSFLRSKNNEVIPNQTEVFNENKKTCTFT